MSGRRCDRLEQEQVQAEGDASGGRGVGLQGAVDGVEDVVDGAGVEVGGGGGAALAGEGEVGMEGFDGAGGAVSGRAAEFDEIVGGGNGDE